MVTPSRLRSPPRGARALLHLALFLVGCGPSAATLRQRADDVAQGAIAEIREAAKTRDLAKLQALAAHPSDDPRVAAELAHALYWTADVTAAAPLLAAVCNDARLAPDTRARTGACAIAAFAALAAERPLNQVRTPGEGAFVAQQKLLVALVAVDDHPPEPFIVDTGAPMTIIAKRFADRIGLAYRTDVAERSQDAGGHVVSLNPTLLATVRWGGLTVATVPAYVLELPENFKVGGILAPQDLLRGTAFELDGPAKVLRTWGETTGAAWSAQLGGHTREAPLAWNGGNLFVAAVAVDLPSLQFLLDSGAGGNGVCAETLQAHGKALAGGVAAKGATAGGKADVRTGLSGTLSVAAEPAQAGPLFVAHCTPDTEELVRKAGYVGAPWFAARRVFFPRDRRAIVFTDAPPAAPVAPTPSGP